MATPFFDLIEELRALGGAPKVTYPTGDNSYPQTERTIKARRGSQILAMGSAEPDAVRFPNNILTQQIELQSDAQYVEVYRKYEVLPSPILKTFAQEEDTLLALNGTKRDVLASTASEPSLVPGIQTGFAPREGSDFVSEETTEAFDDTEVENYFRAYVRTGGIGLPAVLLGINIIWSVTEGSGAGSSSGHGFSVGVSANLTLPASARAQGSAGVEPQIQPIWGPMPPDDLPLVDFKFRMPNNATRAQILTACSAYATAYFGIATTINDWPIWRAVKHNFVMVGSKFSISADADARVSVSVIANSTGGVDVSETIISGGNTSQDVSPSVRPMTLPDCIHGAITPSGFTNLTASQTITATADVTGGENFPAANSSKTASGTASGWVSPISLSATAIAAYPTSGIYGKPVSILYKKDYCEVTVTTFDFSVLSGSTTPLPQITTLDWAAAPMASYVTGGAGLALIIPYTEGIIGLWFNTGTETQPDLSGYGVTTYIEIDPAIVAVSTATLATGFGSNADLAFVAVTAGAAGNAVSIAYVNPGTINASLSVSVTSNAIAVNLATNGGSQQITTATAVGAVTGAGSASVVVTGANIAGSPITTPVPVNEGDTPSVWAAEVIAALQAVSAITDVYTVSGAGASIVLTAIIGAANDSSLNIAISTGAASGITAAPTSAATQAGGLDPAPISTGAQILAAIQASTPASALTTVALAGGNNGTGTPPVMSATNLSGGFSQPTPANIATLVEAYLNGSGVFTAALTNSTTVHSVSIATGPQSYAYDVDSGAVINVIQPGQ